MKKIFQIFPDSIFRVGIIFILFVSAVVFVRFLIPSSLKNGQEHVKATVERESSRPVKYAGSDVCADCHDEYKTKMGGYHKNLSCGTCHGAAKEHSEDPESSKPVLPKKRENCALCHMYNASRPTGFPQINPAAHNPLKPCIACHNPHDPKPPTVPQECQACHAEIARTKAVSPHVQLECTECHTVPPQHKIAPRDIKALIPSDRSFCGKCHSKKSTVKETPKIDFSTHGEKYLCWQCHYPHMPEVE